MPNKEKRSCNNCTSKVHKIDQYGRAFSFYLPGGKKSQKSFHGCWISVVSLFIVIFYSMMQLMKLMEFGDPSIMVSSRDAYFDTDYELNTDTGL